jgi:phosphoglycerate kinase
MDKLSVEDLRVDDLHGKTALMRVDFNVPLDDSGEVLDDTRIASVLPTIEYLVDRGLRLVLVSHLGRPKGTWNDSMSLAPVSRKLEELLGKRVIFVDDPLSGETADRVRRMTRENIFLLENVRFYPGEEANDADFSETLSQLGDLFVNDAFGTAHREHASTVGVTQHLSPCVAGLLMKAEIDSLMKMLSLPERPFVAIIGGAKIKGKIEVIRNPFGKGDSLLIGGAMANTFLVAKGYPVGTSKYDEERVETAQSLIRESEEAGCDLILPQDCVITRELKAGAAWEVVSADHISDGWMAVDIGPLTKETFRDRIVSSKTVMWNGPMGVFEVEPFSAGTVDIARTVAEATKQGAFTLLGGGDSVAAIRLAGLEKEISHISTGGGASLEFLGGNILPGIEALTDRESNSQGGAR